MTFTKKMTDTHVYDIFTFALYFGFAEQPQVGTYSLSDLAVQLQILALWLLLLLSWYSCSKTHLCTCKCRCERAEPGVGLGWEWSYFIGRCLTSNIGWFLCMMTSHSSSSDSQCFGRRAGFWENAGCWEAVVDQDTPFASSRLPQQTLLYCRPNGLFYTLMSILNMQFLLATNGLLKGVVDCFFSRLDCVYGVQCNMFMLSF